MGHPAESRVATNRFQAEEGHHSHRACVIIGAEENIARRKFYELRRDRCCSDRQRKYAG